MHSKCTLFTSFVVVKTYLWFIQKLSETIHDLCRENFLSHQQETFFSKWGRNSVYSLDHKTPPYQHRNHRIWRKIKPAFITFWPRTESRLCFADCRITACVRRLSSWRWLWKLKEQLLWKNSQRLWNRVNIFLSQGLLLISIIIRFFLSDFSIFCPIQVFQSSPPEMIRLYQSPLYFFETTSIKVHFNQTFSNFVLSSLYCCHVDLQCSWGRLFSVS